MYDEFQTAANSKNHAGDARSPDQFRTDRAVQISEAQIKKFVKAYEEARNELDWAMSMRATSEACAWWLGRKVALRHVLAELGIEAPEEI